MKQKLLLFIIHQTATSLQQTYNLDPGTRWYPALGESNRMKSAYFTIHPGKNPPPHNGCRLNYGFFLKQRFHILHFPNSTGLFIKTIGRHYANYWFSPDIELKEECNTFEHVVFGYRMQCPWRFLGITGHNLSEFPRPTGYVLWSFGISLWKWKSIMYTLKWSISILKSSTSTGCLSNSIGS